MQLPSRLASLPPCLSQQLAHALADNNFFARPQRHGNDLQLIVFSRDFAWSLLAREPIARIVIGKACDRRRALDQLFRAVSNGVMPGVLIPGNHKGGALV